MNSFSNEIPHTFYIQMSASKKKCLGKKVCPGSDYHSRLPFLSSASGSPVLLVTCTEPRRLADRCSWMAVLCSAALKPIHWALGAHRGISRGGQAVTGLGGHLLLCASMGESTTWRVGSCLSAKQHLLNPSYSKRHMPHHQACCPQHPLYT